MPRKTYLWYLTYAVGLKLKGELDSDSHAFRVLKEHAPDHPDLARLFESEIASYVDKA